MLRGGIDMRWQDSELSLDEQNRMVKAADRDSTGQLSLEANRKRKGRVATYLFGRVSSRTCVVQIHAAAFIV